MKICNFFNAVIIVSAITCVYSARILCLFPTPYHSHHLVLHEFTKELAKEGHNLVVMTPEPLKTPIQNVTEIDVRAVSYIIQDGMLENVINNHDRFGIDFYTFWQMTFNISRSYFKAQIDTQKMQELLSDESEKFDLIFIQGNVRISLMLRARFQAPVVIVNTFVGSVENFKTVGAETNFLLYPDMTVRSILNLGFWDRISKYLKNLRLRWLFSSSKCDDDVLIRERFGENAPKMSELQEKIEMLFMNANRIWDRNRPTPPSVVYMGALQLKKPKPLPKDLQSYFDNSKNGVIYFSLGSKIKSSMLPQRAMEIIKKVIATLPYDVLWKWPDVEMSNKPKNVRLEKWLPQNDLLYHPKLKAFITHGGLQSTDEAIAANVPLIGLPMYGDQWQNTELYQRFEIGFKFDVDHLDENEFRNAILEVTGVERYRENMRRLSRAVAEQRSRNGVGAAAFWVRHLTTYGGRHLRSPLFDVTTIELYMFDLIATALSFILIAWCGIVFAVKRLIRRCRRNVNEVKNNGIRH